MKPRPGTCPITRKTYPEGESKCPITRLFNWCRWRASSIVPTLPYREKNDVFEQLMHSSVAFSDMLLGYEKEVTQKLMKRADMYLGSGKINQRSQAFEKLFVQYGTSFNGVLCDDFLLIFREIQIFQREKFLTACHEDEGTYSKISGAYQIGMKIIYDIWRDVYRAFVERYGRNPTPDELKNFESFIVDFARNIAQTPAIFSVPIRNQMVNVQAHPNVFFDEQGDLQFDALKLKHTQHIAHEEFSMHTGDILKPILTNRYCPALPRIPKITQMCCNVFRETYTHIYHQFEA